MKSIYSPDSLTFDIDGIKRVQKRPLFYNDQAELTKTSNTAKFCRESEKTPRKHFKYWRALLVELITSRVTLTLHATNASH